jgi:uncharacterized protein YqgV (UPF0045/DUF77 family)
VDTSAVWNQTDLFSTLYRGEQASVVDAVEALFMHSVEPNVHLATELTFSKGCPGDIDADRFLTGEQARPNQQNLPLDFPVQCKYSFYSFGEKDYMAEIAEIVALASAAGLNPQSAHYVTILEGSATQLFDYFTSALEYAHEHLQHYVLEATISVNSPSRQGVH